MISPSTTVDRGAAVHESAIAPSIRHYADTVVAAEGESNRACAEPHTVSGIRRIAYCTVAFLCLVLGAIGVLLPGLPTTPFVLLASFLFAKASPAMNARLLRSRIFGGLLRDWQRHRGIASHIKCRAVALVVVVAALSVCFTPMSGVAHVAVALGCLTGIVVIVRLPTIPCD